MRRAPTISDPNVIRLLTYSKYLYTGAWHRLSSPSSLEVAEAILRLHDALEIFQIAVLTSLGAEPDKTPKFWEKVKENKGIDLPFKGEFNAFNKVRVNFKHYAVITELTEMRRVSAFVPSFFSHACLHALGIDYSTVSLADLVEHAEARELVKKAEELIASEKWKDAVAQIARAFCVLMAEKHADKPAYSAFNVPLFEEWEIQLPGWLSEDRELRPTTRSSLEEFFKGLQSQVNEMKEVLEALGWGIDIQRYKKFKFLTPIVDRSSFGIMVVAWPRPIALLGEHAGFCLEFVLETALNIQQRRFEVRDEFGRSWAG